MGNKNNNSKNTTTIENIAPSQFSNNRYNTNQERVKAEEIKTYYKNEVLKSSKSSNKNENSNIKIQNNSSNEEHDKILNNFFRKSYENYSTSIDYIKKGKLIEASNLLKTTEKSNMELHRIILAKPEYNNKKHVVEKINNSIKVIREKISFCEEQLNENLKIKQHFQLNKINNGLQTTSKRNELKEEISFTKPNKFNQSNSQDYQSNIKKQKSSSSLSNRISSEILTEVPGIKFENIIGMEQTKRLLKEIIILPKIRPDLFTGLRSPPRGLLLFGPPGTGKTLIAKAVATECGCTFFNISASSLTSKWVGESEKLVRELFESASKQPSIIFIDEIESILSKRSENDNEGSKRIKTEFLVQFDGLNTDSNDKLLVIAATNRPGDIDLAVLRRFPKRVYIPPLDLKERIYFLQKLLYNIEHKLNNAEFVNIAKLTCNYSNSDLKELCREAAFEPLRELGEIELKNVKKLRPLIISDFIKAVKKVRGTLTPATMKELEIWNNQYGAIN